MPEVQRIGVGMAGVILYLLIGLPVAIEVYFCLVDPRPFYVAFNDNEHDYYYGAQLIARGYAQQYIHHPGTPLYYMGSFLLGVVGTHLSRADLFLVLGRLIAAVATSVALLLFVRLLAVYYSHATLVLAVASILAWPPVLLFTNSYGTEALLAAIGLVPLTWCWWSIQKGEPNWRLLVATGLATGVCLAFKMAFVPVAASLWLASTVQLLQRHSRKSWLLLMPASMATGFVVMNLPVLDRLVLVLYGTFRRPEIHVSASMGDWIEIVGSLWPRLWSAAGPLMLLWALAAVLGIRWAIVRRAGVAKDPEIARDLPATTLLALMSGAFAYTVLASRNSRSDILGLELRNTTPCALLFPFLVLYASRGVARSIPGAFRAKDLAAGILAGLVVGYGVVDHCWWRHEYIRHTLETNQRVLTFLDSVAPETGRIALWDGSPGATGSLSFHWWGDQRYGACKLDGELLEMYPRWTWFRLRDVCRHLRGLDRPGGKSSYGALGAWFWRTFMGRGPKSQCIPGALVAGEVSAVRLIAFPAAEWEEESGRLPIGVLVDYLRESYGDCQVDERRIDGQRWILIWPSDGSPKWS